MKSLTLTPEVAALREAIIENLKRDQALPKATVLEMLLALMAAIVKLGASAKIPPPMLRQVLEDAIGWEKEEQEKGQWKRL